MGFFNIFKKQKIKSIAITITAIKNSLPFYVDRHMPDRKFDTITLADLCKVIDNGVRRDVTWDIYIPELWDCENFAGDFKTQLQKKLVGVGVNIPCAIVKYRKDNGVWHAINLVKITDGDGYVFIEPQTCNVVELSSSELQSINKGFCRF